MTIDTAWPKSEQFLETAKSVLEGMTGPRAWGGAYPNVPTVERSFRQSNSVTKHPHLLLLQMESRSEFFTHDAPVNRLKHLVVHIVGFVGKEDGRAPGSWVEFLAEDVQVTLLDAMQPGGALVGFANLVRFDEDATLYGFDDQGGEFVLPMTADIG